MPTLRVAKTFSKRLSALQNLIFLFQTLVERINQTNLNLINKVNKVLVPGCKQAAKVDGIGKLGFFAA